MCRTRKKIFTDIVNTIRRCITCKVVELRKYELGIYLYIFATVPESRMADGEDRIFIVSRKPDFIIATDKGDSREGEKD